MNEEELSFLLKDLPWILIIAWLIYSVLCIMSRSIRDKFSNIYVFETLPSVFVTLGLLGTFSGITYGLLEFDTSPDKIKESIQLLLFGLKSAMLTTIAGVCLSLIFGKIVQIIISKGKIDVPVSEEVLAINRLNDNFVKIGNTLKESQTEGLKKGLEGVLQDFNIIMDDFISQLVEKNFEKLAESVNTLVSWQEEYRGDVKGLMVNYKAIVSNHEELVDNSEKWVLLMDQIAGQSSQLQKVLNEFNVAFSDDGKLSGIITDIQKTTEGLSKVTDNYTSLSEGLNKTMKKYEDTGSKVEEWTNSVKQVSDSSTRMLDNIRSLQSIDVDNLDRMFKSMDELFTEYMKSLDKAIISKIGKNERK